MESVGDERFYDAEETIFVAVGKDFDKCKTMLFWAAQSFAGKKICLLHVLQPANGAALRGRQLCANKLNEDASKGFQEFERKKIHDVLNEHCLVLARDGVQTDKVWIEMGSIEEGITELIARYRIRWLVMGAAADKYYSKKLTDLRSKKAIFICQHAPISCHIWFVCKGCLIYTRECINDKYKAEIAAPMLELNSDSETGQGENFVSEFIMPSRQSLDSVEDAGDLEGISGRFSYQCAVDSSQSTNKLLDTSQLINVMTDEGRKTDGQKIGNGYWRLEHAIRDAKDLKQNAFGESLLWWKEDDKAMEAKCKAKGLERLSVKEMSLRKEMEETLARKKQEVEKTRSKCDEFQKELQIVNEQKSLLECQLGKSQSMVKELEEKIISAVELLISFRAKRDAAQVEYEKALREIRKLRILAKVGAVNFCRSEILEFSFVEINEATNDFDPSWKIGEGRYGAVYRGLLRHMQVAIKMLPSYGSQSQLEYQNRVEFVSRVRHPNLVTLIGSCHESRSLVYEYVINGSLEDRLACKGNMPPLPWQTRAHIAMEICSALVFLHSSKPCIIHGNLKPSKVLLDANFVCKLSDIGIFQLIPQSENMLNTIRKHPNSTSVYIDPEYLETGMVTPESDVYSFGIILLLLLIGRPLLDIVKDAQCAIEKENFKAVLDCSAGDWPLEQAQDLAILALRCCNKNRLNRPDLVSEIWAVLEPMRASLTDSGTRLPVKKLHKIPSHFVCPIFQEVMKDPQIAADGFTYDAEAIRGWLKSGHNTSPMTNLKLEHCNLLPNHALHQAILEWQQQW